MPLAVLGIQQMLRHIIPTGDSNQQILLGAEILIEVDVTDDVLTLYPPLALEIILIPILPMLIHHTSIWAQSLVGSIGYSADDALYLAQQLLIAQDECRLMEQPGSLNVMTITFYISFSLPLIIEEQVKMIGLLVQKLICKDVEQVADTFFQFISLPYTIEIGIGFYDMEMGIHRAGSVLILIRKTHIGDRLPLTGQRLNISIVLGIKGMLLDVVI